MGYWSATDVVQLRSPDGRGILGAEHLSALREPHLQALAGRVGYSYARLTGPDSIVSAMRDEHFVRRESAPVDLYWISAVARVVNVSASLSFVIQVVRLPSRRWNNCMRRVAGAISRPIRSRQRGQRMSNRSGLWRGICIVFCIRDVRRAGAGDTANR